MLSDFSPEVDWSGECSQQADSQFISRLVRNAASNNDGCASRRSNSRNSRRGPKKKLDLNEKTGANLSNWSTLNNLKNLKSLLEMDSVTQVTNNHPRLQESIGDCPASLDSKTSSSHLTNMDVLARLLPPKRKTVTVTTDDEFTFKECSSSPCSNSDVLNLPEQSTTKNETSLLETTVSPVVGRSERLPLTNSRSLNERTLVDQSTPKNSRVESSLKTTSSSSPSNNAPVHNMSVELVCDKTKERKKDSFLVENDFNSSILDDELIMASQIIFDQEKSSDTALVTQTSKSLQSFIEMPPKTFTFAQRTRHTVNPPTGQCVTVEPEESPKALRSASGMQRVSTREPVVANTITSEMNESIDSLFMSKSQPISNDEGFDSNDEDFFNIDIESDDSFAKAACEMPLDNTNTLFNQSKTSYSRSQTPKRVESKPQFKRDSTPGTNNIKSFKRCASFQSVSKSSGVSSSSLQNQIETKRQKALEKLQQRNHVKTNASSR